jgi:hypothetical protein
MVASCGSRKFGSRDAGRAGCRHYFGQPQCRDIDEVATEDTIAPIQQKARAVSHGKVSGSTMANADRLLRPRAFSISINGNKERVATRLLQRLRDLGVNVEVKAA